MPEQQVAVCVERVDSRHQVRTYTRLGMVSNPLDLASGRCLLAFRPEAELAELLPVLLCGHEAAVDPGASQIGLLASPSRAST